MNPIAKARVLLAVDKERAKREARTAVSASSRQAVGDEVPGVQYRVTRRGERRPIKPKAKRDRGSLYVGRVAQMAEAKMRQSPNHRHARVRGAVALWDYQLGYFSGKDGLLGANHTLYQDDPSGWLPGEIDLAISVLER